MRIFHHLKVDMSGIPAAAYLPRMAAPFSVMEPRMKRLGAVRIDIPQSFVSPIGMEIVLFLRGVIAAGVTVFCVTYSTKLEKVICRHGWQTSAYRLVILWLQGRLFYELSDIRGGDVFEKVGSCFGPDIPKILSADRAGAMLWRQILSDKIVIGSRFQHIDAILNSIDQPVHKL